MSWSQVFSLAVLPVLPLWVLMIFAPGWRWTARIVSQPWTYAPLAVLYTALLIRQARELVEIIVVNPRLEDVAPLLGTPAGATIAWVHFLAFDVFVGRWAFLDGRTRAISPFLMAPVLALILLFGPLGLLLYLIVRTTGRRSVPNASG